MWEYLSLVTKSSFMDKVIKLLGAAVRAVGHQVALLTLCLLSLLGCDDFLFQAGCAPGFETVSQQVFDATRARFKHNFIVLHILLHPLICLEGESLDTNCDPIQNPD